MRGCSALGGQSSHGFAAAAPPGRRRCAVAHPSTAPSCGGATSTPHLCGSSKLAPVPWGCGSLPRLCCGPVRPGSGRPRCLRVCLRAYRPSRRPTGHSGGFFEPTNVHGHNFAITERARRWRGATLTCLPGEGLPVPASAATRPQRGRADHLTPTPVHGLHLRPPPASRLRLDPLQETRLCLRLRLTPAAARLSLSLGPEPRLRLLRVPRRRLLCPPALVAAVDASERVDGSCTSVNHVPAAGPLLPARSLCQLLMLRTTSSARAAAPACRSARSALSGCRGRW